MRNPITAKAVCSTLAVLLLGIPGACRADLVFLTNGGVLEGKVHRKKGKVYIVMAGGTVTIPEDKIEYIEKKDTILDEYENRLAAIDEKAEGAAQAFADLGKWCANNRLKAQASTQLKKALALDSNNETARLALGYERYQEKWMTSDEVQRARGLVRHGDAWVTPEAKADLVRLDAETQSQRARAQAEALKLQRAEAEAIEARAKAEAALAETEALREGLYNRYSNPYSYPIYYSGSRGRRHVIRNRCEPLRLGPGDTVRYSTRSPLGVPTVRADGSTAILRIVTPGTGLGAPTVGVVTCPEERARALADGLNQTQSGGHSWTGSHPNYGNNNP